MVTQDCKEKIINYIQCKLANMGNAWTSSLQTRKKDLDCLTETAKILDAYVCLLYRYFVFTDTPTYAYKVTIDKEETETAETLTLSINAVNLGAWTGTGTGAEACSYLKSYINENTSTPEYLAEYVGSTLYIYSAAAVGISYTYTPYIDEGGSEYDSYTYSSLENKEEEILDALNTITSVQVDEIIHHAFLLLNDYTTDNTGTTSSTICQTCG